MDRLDIDLLQEVIETTQTLGDHHGDASTITQLYIYLISITSRHFCEKHTK
jgi:hypothetical protein